MRLFKRDKNFGDGRLADQPGKKYRVLVIKYFFPVISAAMLLLLAALAYFLYYDAYLSIGHGQNVALLKQQISEEDLKSDELSRAIEAINQKNRDTEHSLETINNPFQRKWEIKK